MDTQRFEYSKGWEKSAEVVAKDYRHFPEFAEGLMAAKEFGEV